MRRPPVFVSIAAATALCYASVAWACSGPGALAAILRAERLGWILFGVTVALVAVGVLLARRSGYPWLRMLPMILVVGVHPGWWMSARTGDCGHIRWLTSAGVTGLAVVAVVLLLWRARIWAKRARTRALSEED